MPSSILPEPTAAPVVSASGDDTLYEVVNGVRMELPPMGAFQTNLATILVTYLCHFGRKNKLGRAVAEMLFLLDRANNLQRRPDVAFVSYQAWPRNQRVPDTAAWEIVPGLTVEVVSPSNLADEVVVKVGEYFRAGVQLVWVVFPIEEQVYVYTSPTEVRVLTRNDELDGGAVVPEFRLPVSTLFDEETEV